ncbi:acyl-CoA desaturase [Amycolatopsis minnesotensis]|uniref:Acyl-CoA desaturase n=1 Tax=Amycolatopsis minnesotensis TaxID=337894 RepID=A0ABP5DW53_9PSEU
MSDAASVTVRGDYTQLMKLMRQSGLLERRYGYYFAKMTLTLLAFAAGWVALFLVGDSWWQLLVAGFLGFMFTQVAMIGHDAGHRQIFTSRKPSSVIGLVLGNLFVGLSWGWWIDKHTRHHAHPNQEELDPDISVEVLVFSEEQAHKMRRSWISQFITRYQAILFFPLLLLEGLNLHVSSVEALVKGKVTRAKWLEVVLLSIHLVTVVGTAFLLLSPGKAIAFLAVQQAVFGFYMGCSFAPNHKGMPIFAREEKIDFLRRQVLTSRNIRGGVFADFLLGGLNYQIEHHLFPSMPRCNLKHAQHVVRDFCREHSISYYETSAARSYYEVLQHLHESSRPLRVGQPG